MKWYFGLAVAGVLGAVMGVTGRLAWADDKPLTDREFLKESVIHSACQVRAGELAGTRARAREVQQLARKLLVEQEKFDPTLTELTVYNKVALMSNQEVGRKRCESRLGRLRGDTFDREFLGLLVVDLGEWINLLDRAVKLPVSEAEVNLAVKMLPVLRRRLEDAKRLQQAAP